MISKLSITWLLYLITIVSGNRLIEIHTQHRDHHLQQPGKARIHHIHKLIAHYKAQHGAKALRTEFQSAPELLCSRKFVDGTSLACCNFGNSNIRYFSAFLHSIILNRTFVATEATVCPGTLTSQDWFIKTEELLPLLEKAKCPLLHGLAGENIGGLPSFVNKSLIGLQPDNYCFADLVPDRTMSFRAADLKPWELYNKCQGPLALGPEAARRVRVLHSHPVYWQSFFESNGFAFMSTVQFTPSVTQHVQGVLQELFPGYVNMRSFSFPADTITISMHIRHRDQTREVLEKLTKDEKVMIDAIYNETLYNLLVSRFPGKQCRLLLASDNAETIMRISSDATSLGCKVYTAPKNLSTPAPEGNFEQGPWHAGVVQMADLYLLAHSQYFIGHGYSTFAWSIGYLFAYVKAMVDPSDMEPAVDMMGGKQHVLCWVNGEPWGPVCPVNVTFGKLRHWDAKTPSEGLTH